MRVVAYNRACLQLSVTVSVHLTYGAQEIWLTMADDILKDIYWNTIFSNLYSWTRLTFNHDCYVQEFATEQAIYHYVNQSVKQRGGLFEITRPMTYECIRKLGTYLHPRNDHPIKKLKIFHKIQWRTCPEGPQIQAWYFRQACIRSIWAPGMELFAKGN